jgi:hypothetical protein
MEAVRGELVGTQGDFAGEDVPEYYENGEHEIIGNYVGDELAAVAAIYEELRDSAFFEELMGDSLTGGTRARINVAVRFPRSFTSLPTYG